MTTLFLSHSSRDRLAVKQLAEALRKRNVSVWLDEWQIEVGESISERIQKGLAEARFVAVWLTPHAVMSGWVTKEWQVKIYNEISTKQVTVLPLLAADCDIPLFLSDKKYADFRVSFREGIASLMRALNRQTTTSSTSKNSTEPHFSILDQTKGFLRDLEEAQIPFPTVGNLRIVKSLKALPRSGKLLRLENMLPALPIRSVYDHVLSVAHSADCMLPLIDSGIFGRDRIELARVIAYHDVCEVILGDIPQYTRLNRSKRNRARVAAEILLSQMTPGEPEKIANKFIAMFLQESERQCMLQTMEILQGDSSIRRLFYALDKLDPILGVWRYINTFRALENFSIDDFLSRTRHFFENPIVRMVISKNISDPRAVELVNQLQTQSKAKQYFTHSSVLSDELFAFPPETIHNLIEGRTLEFATLTGRRNIPKI